MTERVTIGELARLSGVPARTIRFYETVGALPRPDRTAAGYRLYGRNDLRRLRLIRRARAMGLPLDDARALADHAFAADCREYVLEVGDLLDRHCATIEARIAELTALRDELRGLARRAREVAAAAPERRVADCAECPIVDDADTP